MGSQAAQTQREREKKKKAKRKKEAKKEKTKNKEKRKRERTRPRTREKIFSLSAYSGNKILKNRGIIIAWSSEKHTTSLLSRIAAVVSSPPHTPTARPILPAGFCIWNEVHCGHYREAA